MAPRLGTIDSVVEVLCLETVSCAWDPGRHLLLWLAGVVVCQLDQVRILPCPALPRPGTLLLPGRLLTLGELLVPETEAYASTC